MVNRGSVRKGIEEWNKWKIDLIIRWEKLRKLGRIYPLLAEGNIIWRFGDTIDPWGSKYNWDWKMLEKDIRRFESEDITECS